MKRIEIKSDVFWVKIVGFLQQNWAVIEVTKSGVTVFFIDDASKIVDKIEFPSLEEAEKALKKNGFSLFLGENENFQDFMAPPKRPFHELPRPFYSSGEFWKQ